jgi:hypothetical protein
MSNFRVRESVTFRRIDCAFPSEAAKEMHAMIGAEMDAGVYIRLERSGPLVVDFPNVSMAVTNWLILIEETHATRIILQMNRIAAKFDLVDDNHFGDFGD